MLSLAFELYSTNNETSVKLKLTANYDSKNYFSYNASKSLQKWNWKNLITCSVNSSVNGSEIPEQFNSFKDPYNPLHVYTEGCYGFETYFGLH